MRRSAAENAYSRTVDLSWLPLATLRILAFLAVLVAHPTVKRAGGHDRDQLFNGPAEGFAILQQSLPFFRLGMNLAFDAAAEDLVLFLQELDILRQLTVCTRSNQREQWMKNLRHRGIVVTSYSGGSYTFLVPRFEPDFERRNDAKMGSLQDRFPRAVTTGIRAVWRALRTACRVANQLQAARQTALIFSALSRTDITDKPTQLPTNCDMV